MTRYGGRVPEKSTTYQRRRLSQGLIKDIEQKFEDINLGILCVQAYLMINEARLAYFSVNEVRLTYYISKEVGENTKGTRSQFLRDIAQEFRRNPTYL